MAASHPEELKEQARQMLEEEGCTLTEVARRLGLTASVVQGWAKSRGWVVPEVIRQVRVQEQKMVVDPALDLLIKRMEGLPRASREADYDEAMHRLACSVPLMLRQMTAQELVTKADKVAKLVEMSRNVLGRSEKQRASPMLNLGVLLSSSGLPERRAEVVELPAPELDAE
jgi:transposase-like protein/DNA-binding XRE family transcriptional regulator